MADDLGQAAKHDPVDYVGRALVELDDAEQDPQVDDHAHEHMRLHPLDAHQVVEKLQEGGELEPLEDLPDLVVLLGVHSLPLGVGALVGDSVQDENAKGVKAERGLPTEDLEGVVEHEPELGELQLGLDGVYFLIHCFYFIYLSALDKKKPNYAVFVL